MARHSTDTRSKDRARTGSRGKVCYAIGDVHGRLDLLEDLLSRIASDSLTRGQRETHVVFLGDLVDRGPDSRGVLERVQSGAGFDASFHFLMGNHESLMIQALRGSETQLRAWLKVGGWQCAQSFGVEIGSLFGQPEERILSELLDHIPEATIRFLESFSDSVRFGDYFLVHAGVRPNVALDLQRAQDLHWIREPFLSSTRDYESLIVHGHSVSAEVEVRPNRIGIDTGAWKTGVLTALWIDGDERGFLEARGAALQVAEEHQLF